jgi:nicotinamidase-related amidase
MALRLEQLLRFAALLDLPTIATRERPVAEKGPLPDRLVAALPDDALSFEKSTFDCMAEPDLRAAIEATGCGTIAVAGGETDVCVLLSSLALRREGYEVHLLEDCVFSSTPDTGAARARMRAAGVAPTTLKTFCYELTGCVQAAWPETWRARSALFPDLDVPAP